MKFYCGTPLNMAPEILNDRYYNHRADIWSLGVAIFETIFVDTPFNGNDKPDLIKNVNLGIAKIPNQYIIPTLPIPQPQPPLNTDTA